MECVVCYISNTFSHPVSDWDTRLHIKAGRHLSVLTLSCEGEEKINDMKFLIWSFDLMRKM